MTFVCLSETTEGHSASFPVFTREYLEEAVNCAPIRPFAQPAEAPMQKLIDFPHGDTGKIRPLAGLQCFFDHVQVPRGRIVTGGTYGKRKRLVNEVSCKFIEFWITVQFTHFFSPVLFGTMGERIRFDSPASNNAEPKYSLNKYVEFLLHIAVITNRRPRRRRNRDSRCR